MVSNQEVGKLDNWEVVRKLKSGKLERCLKLEEKSHVNVWRYIQWKFYHNSVSGLKVETDWKDNYGKKGGGLEILIIE